MGPSLQAWKDPRFLAPPNHASVVEKHANARYPTALSPGIQGEGEKLGNPKDSVWEDWGTLGLGESPPPLKNPIMEATKKSPIENWEPTYH